MSLATELVIGVGASPLANWKRTALLDISSMQERLKAKRGDAQCVI
jgi:hypothetical protein